MGFFRDRNFEKLIEQARQNGLREGDGVKECEDCRHVASADCLTGLVCTGRTYNDGSYMVVPASWVCDHFEWKG